MKIIIGNKEYKLKYTIRSLFVYEQITGVSFSPDKLINEYTLMYAILVANNDDFSLTFEEFIKLCDEDVNAFIEFRNWLLDVLKQQVLWQTDNQEKESDDKKKD